MARDDTYMGRVPDCSAEQFAAAADKRLGDKKELNWTTFRHLLDDVPWRTVQKHEVQLKVDQLYEEANILLRAGKRQESFNECLKAAGITRHFSTQPTARLR